METTSPSPQEASLIPEGEILEPATPNDLDDIRIVMQEASDFKYSRGDDLWGTEPFTDEEVNRMIESGNMFIYRRDGELAASVLLLPNDERMWGGEQGSDGSALYIHKLVTGNAFRGQGVGAKVLSLAEELARNSGKTKIRLDCPQDSPLSAYYEKQGFREVRRYDRPLSPGRRNPDKDVFKAALLEKDISMI